MVGGWLPIENELNFIQMHEHPSQHLIDHYNMKLRHGWYYW